MRLQHRVERGMVRRMQAQAAPFANDVSGKAFNLERAAIGDVVVHRRVHAGRNALEPPEPGRLNIIRKIRAIGPRDCVMVEGNPHTQAALERAGAIVQTYSGREISLKGGGGPTCLTRPIARRPA